MRRYASTVVVSLFVLCWAASRLAGAGGTRAQVGHGAPRTAQPAQEAAAVRPGDAATVAAQLGVEAVRNPLDCRGCHGAGKPLPYLGGSVFHREAHAAHTEGVHARAAAAGKRGATCLDCHAPDGRQETILPSSDPASSVNRANVSKTCAKCHEQQAGTFRDSIHGAGQARGINAAATCSDCHGAHNVYPASDPRSLMSRANTLATCAGCHTTILTDFEASSHGAALRQNDDRAPVCTTCHTSVSHARAPLSTREFNFEAISQCSRCHERQGPSYRDTFHGQAAALGFRPAATCADCHTPHRNLPASDARSTVHRANLTETCGKCHQNAGAGFVTYDPHAEPTDPRRSLLVYAVHGFMKWLFVLVFGFFGLHTLLWLQRSVVAWARGESHRIRDGERWVVRFARPHRWTHVVMVVSFLALAATGLPLMFYYTNWGQSLMRALGGVGVSRVVHRIFGVVTFGYFLFHLGYLAWRGGVGGERLFGGPGSMLPRRKDFDDLRRMFRWFVYREKRPPRLDRWTYWEKFDYFAVFWGVPVIGLSGLMLWHPGFVTKFLPGSWLNVAMIVHGEEALLAVGFIFAFHFFHNHMRPENFPLDTVIFTGKMPLRRFEEERPEEYARLKEEGRLEEILTGPPSPRARALSTAFGLATYALGLVLIVAIFTTLLLYH